MVRISRLWYGLLLIGTGAAIVSHAEGLHLLPHDPWPKFANVLSGLVFGAALGLYGISQLFVGLVEAAIKMLDVDP